MSPECIELIRSLRLVTDGPYNKVRVCPKCKKRHQENRRIENNSIVNWLSEYIDNYSDWCLACLQLEILLPSE